MAKDVDNFIHGQEMGREREERGGHKTTNYPVN